MEEGIIPTELENSDVPMESSENIRERSESTRSEVGPDGLPINYGKKPEKAATVDDEEAPSTITTGEEKPEKLEEEEKEDEPLRVRRFATIMNFLNSLLGAGILSVPNAMAYLGIVPSVIVLALIAVLSHIATVLTIKLAHRADAKGLDDLALRVTGKVGSVILSILSMIFLIAATISFLIINFGTIASWFELGSIDVVHNKLYRALCIIVYALIIPIPLTFPKNIKFLSYCSYVSFGAIVFFMISLIIKAGIILPYPNDKAPQVTIATMNMGIFSAISIFGLAFSLPIVVLPIIAPYNPDLHKRSIVSFVSVTICFVVIAIPGIIGYMLFGNATKSIILENFAANDGLMIAVKIGFFFCVSFSYPAVARSIMASWSQLIFHNNVPSDLKLWKRAIIIVLTNVIPLVIAVFLPDARPVLGIGGAFGGCLVDFFYPPLMWIMLSKKRWFHWQNLLCILLCVFGIVSGVVSTYQAVLDAIAAFKR